MKPIAGLIRDWQLRSVVRNAGRVYSDFAPEKIPSYQLEKFNQLWVGIRRQVPFYRKLVAEGFAPSEGLTWEDFVRLPKLSRIEIQRDVSPYLDDTKPIANWSVTGGSTGMPIRIPRWANENDFTLPAIWLGRASYGIQVSDRMFHLWGHSHLFGRGWQRYQAQLKRAVKNFFLGYRTFSAYNLNPKRLDEAGRALLQMKPEYIVGYSRSLFLLAKANFDQREKLRGLRIKAVIATTEAFSSAEDSALIADVFGCPVVMEYGAAETGVIAYTHPNDGCYRVFWDLFLLEAIPLDEQRSKLLVTTLYPRAMPLIRYDIGDIAIDATRQADSVIGFSGISGRDNDLIEFEPGSFVHPVALIHCIQSVIGVLGVQVVQEVDSSIRIRIMGKPTISAGERQIRDNLKTLHTRLGNCAIEYVPALEQTIAGKTRWVIRRS